MEPDPLPSSAVDYSATPLGADVSDLPVVEPVQVDMFGDPIPSTELLEVRTRRDTIRRGAVNFRARMERAGIDPRDIIARCMVHWYENGELQKACDAAATLLPYTAAKLNPIALPGASPVPGGSMAGAIRFAWVADVEAHTEAAD